MNTTKLITLLTTIIVCLINKNAFGQENTVKDQDSYVLAVNYNGEWYAMGQSITSKSASAIKIQVKNNSIITSEMTKTIWTFVKDTKGFNLKTEKETFLQYTGTSTNINISNSSSGDGCRWTCEKQSNGCYTIKSLLDTSRALAYSPTGNYFKNFADNDTYNKNIYLLPVCNKDEVTKSLTLKCTWTAEGFNNLDLSDITSVDMRDITIPAGIAPADNLNPNCLFYISPDATNTENLPNLIKVNEDNIATAENIILKDEHDFFNKIPFNGNITYTRHLYDGWSTIALPFPYVINGEHIEKFSNAHSDYIHFTNISDELTANEAYLIYMDMTTDKTFTATNIEVPVTTPMGNTFISNFITFTMPHNDTLYKLNNEGTEFNHSDNSAKVGAFRAYLDLSEQMPNTTSKRIIHDKENATYIKNTNLKIYRDNNTLLIHTDYPQNIEIYDLNGRKVYTLSLNAGINHIDILLKGLYIINNQKVIFK